MEKPDAFDVVVVGGGVAGLTAGLFAARLGRSTLVLVPLVPGGQLATINRIEDFPGFPDAVAGYDLGPGIQEQAAAAGAEIRQGECTRLEARETAWCLTTGDGDVHARAAIIATGSSIRSLGVPGEERLAGKGVSHCASCDGPLLRGKSVAVVGAGDSGLQEALALAEFATQVRVIERLPAPTAQERYRNKVREHGRIEFLGGTTVAEVLGEDAVRGLRVRDAASGETRVLEAAAVFVYVGLAPNTAIVSGLLELDSAGHVPTDIWMRTARAGLFAAGDVRANSAGQAITAAGDGATAACAADRYLRESSPAADRPVADAPRRDIPSSGG